MRIKNFIKLKDCLACCEDRCCQFKPDETKYAPVLTAEEVGLIKRHYDADEHFVKHGESGEVFQIKLRQPKKDGLYFCPFLNEENLCAIHAYRPLDCQLWPFILVKSRDGRSIYLCSEVEECLGWRKIGAEKKKKYKDYMVDLFKSEKSKNLLSRFRGLLWEYDSAWPILAEIKQENFK